MKALIGPHAGLAYSGPTAGYAYRNLVAAHKHHPYERVVLIGPSHKAYLDNIATTVCEEWATPLGNMKVDHDTIDKLISDVESIAKKHGKSKMKVMRINPKYEENEHSLEMHLPFIVKCFKDSETDVELIPLMVGDIPENLYHAYAQALLPHFLDEKTVFCISSDFCHWGERFDFVKREPGKPIHESIEILDKQGIAHIVSHSFEDFTRYLDQSENTICGRHPIQLMLAVIEEAKKVE